jgi:hypothetical protein
MTIIAKPVIEKQYWILKKDNEKIGNIESVEGGGFQVTINNQVEKYRTIKMVQQRANITFEPGICVSKPDTHSVHGYPAGSRVYNPVWDVPNHLPLYTKTKKSKSWFAAGWYAIKRGRKWRVIQDPKLIALERYKFHGPFHSKQTAEQKTHD